MWIEIYLKIGDCSIAHFVNFSRVMNIYRELTGVFIVFELNNYIKIFAKNEDLATAIHIALKQALHGQSTTIEGIGFIKPFLKEQQKELYNYMLLKDLENDMAGGD